jgi:hypothetical protein
MGSLTARSLKLPQGECVETHQPDDCKAKRHECEIQHDRLPKSAGSYRPATSGFDFELRASA